MTHMATEAEIAELVQRTEIATTAFMRGDMERYLELTPHVKGFTLFNPFGGEAGHYEDRRESLLAAASYFRFGEAQIELVSTRASGNILVLVMIERQHGEVGGLPDQTWPLRVTQIYLREGGEWRLAHRHADPLVKVIGLEHAAEIARG
jgi:ketosteroid isomerase-like protein